MLESSAEEVCTELKSLNDMIIGNSMPAELRKELRYAKTFATLDVLAMMFSSKNRVGLKEMQITMGWKLVREYEGDFNANVPLSDIDNVISYNRNDVESTARLLELKKEDVELRVAIEDQGNKEGNWMSVLNKDGSNLGMEIIKMRYLKRTGQKWNDIKDLRSPCDSLALKDIIFDFFEFELPQLKELLSELKSLTINPNDNSFRRSFTIGGLEHTFSLGGLHSVNTTQAFEPKEDLVLIDKDVTSLYPSIVIEHGVCPEHLNKEAFVGIFSDMRKERVEAKHNGDKITNETLKLALNGFTGNLQQQFSWVYSPKAALTIRINGQLMLCMLLERLEKAGVTLIQSNTDGVFFMCEKSKIDHVNELCHEWESITKLNLEDDYFERMYQYAINDYLGVKKGWSETHDYKYIKTKGLFIDEVTLGKGMSPLIIAEALREYFVNGIPAEETIKECKDITKFLTYQKISPKFSVEYGGELTTRINRYYMSTDGKPLKKCVVNPETGERTGYVSICADSNVTIFNELKDIDIKDAHINYNWYLQEVNKILKSFGEKEASFPTSLF
ncbi:MAG: hypothetical protein MJZ16_12900 [Bacteroidales bacterium]|nr:hypothetical protein [Bacteroidales bacterium]